MRRYAALFLAAALAAFGGCAAQPAGSAPKVNYIAPAKLSDREALFLDGAAKESFVFDYEVDGTFQTLKLELETFRDGAPQGSHGSSGPIDFEEGEETARGTVVFAVDSLAVGPEGEQEQWTIFSVLNGRPGGWTRQTTPVEDYPHGDGVASTTGRTESRVIRPGEPVPLAWICFSDSGSVLTTNPGPGPDWSGWAEDYDTAYLLTATFSAERLEG